MVQCDIESLSATDNSRYNAVAAADGTYLVFADSNLNCPCKVHRGHRQGFQRVHVPNRCVIVISIGAQWESHVFELVTGAPNYPMLSENYRWCLSQQRKLNESVEVPVPPAQGDILECVLYTQCRSRDIASTSSSTLFLPVPCLSISKRSLPNKESALPLLTQCHPVGGAVLALLTACLPVSPLSLRS